MPIFMKILTKPIKKKITRFSERDRAPMAEITIGIFVCSHEFIVRLLYMYISD